MTDEILPPDPDLPPAAKRALAEAEARRRAAGEVVRPLELGGRKGPEPVRYRGLGEEGPGHRLLRRPSSDAFRIV